jgi:hypothetical protein
LRFCFLNPADPREVGIEGAFFQSMPPTEPWKASELGHYPQHWYSHIMHCYEVLGYRHPNREIQFKALEIYMKLAHAMHLSIESMDDMVQRLSEDRFATGTVVS